MVVIQLIESLFIFFIWLLLRLKDFGVNVKKLLQTNSLDI